LILKKLFLLLSILKKMKYIYKMSWYDSKRHTKSHTDMFYLQEHDTRWGHENELCRISVVEVEETSNEYDSAVNNDKINKK